MLGKPALRVLQKQQHPSIEVLNAVDDTHGCKLITKCDMQVKHKPRFVNFL
jgi:hypothetical protein